MFAFANAAGQVIGAAFGPARVDGPQWTPTLTVSAVARASTAFAVLEFVIDGALVFEHHYFDNAWVTARPGAAPAIVGPLHTGATAPVMVTEFGWPDRDDGTYNANVIAYAGRQGWGWSVFAWDGTTTGRFDLLTSSAYEPALSGQPVLAGLAANIPG